MVDPKFSEFQFTYGLTKELEIAGPVIGPTFPTQNKEAIIPADVLGWLSSPINMGLKNGDSHLFPFFFQYKRSEKMTTRNAKQWDSMESRCESFNKYYRFDIYLGKNNQHNRLISLAERMPFTYYVAPAFTEREKYRTYASEGNVYENTAFIQCSELRPVAYDKTHVVAYTFPDPEGIVLSSEPLEIEVQQGGEDFLDIEQVQENLREFNELRDVFSELRRQIVYGFNEDQDNSRLGGYEADPQEYDSDVPTRWMRYQKEFFAETIGADTLFFIE